MADRRFGVVHDRLAVEIGRRPERRLAGQAAIGEDADRVAQAVRDRRRHLAEQVVRVLAVDQLVNAVGGLAAGEQQRIALRSHHRIGRHGEAELDAVAVRNVARRAGHDVPGEERLVVAARSRLVGIDAVEIAVDHDRPAAAADVQPLMARRIGLPAGPRRLARQRVAAERRAPHRDRHHVHARHVGHPGHRVGCLAVRHSRHAGVHRLRCQWGGGDEQGGGEPHHMRNVPKRVASIGWVRLAARLSATTRRVSAGSMTPSSHRRALA